MADLYLRFDKAVHWLGLFSLMLLVQKGTAREFIVGGTKGWSVPSNPNEYNQWAERNRFQIGDSLVFNYASGQDSVQYVNNDDYDNCNTAASIQSFSDGHSVFKFNHSGAHHFISGNKDNCLKNEKIRVVVLADRSNRSSTADRTTPPASSPAGPTEGTPSPTPAPAGQVSPSPSPSRTAEINPTPAPANEPPPPSGASTDLIGFMGSVGVLMATSSLFF